MWILNKKTKMKWEIDEHDKKSNDLIKMIEANPTKYEVLVEEVKVKQAKK